MLNKLIDVPNKSPLLEQIVKNLKRLNPTTPQYFPLNLKSAEEINDVNVSETELLIKNTNDVNYINYYAIRILTKLASNILLYPHNY